MVQCQIFSLQWQKRGSAWEELEDAFQCSPTPDSPSGVARGASIRIAVADGATESSYSKEWARLLVDSYCESPFRNRRRFSERAATLGAAWDKYVDGRRPMPWYADQKARMGAHSTFLGLQINGGRDATSAGGLFSSVAIGDSCLFHTRDNLLLRAFPVEESGSFGNRPALISSIQSPASGFPENVKIIKRCEWNPGDVIVIATDALAAWCFKQLEREQEPWSDLTAVASNQSENHDMGNLIEVLRDSGQMRNDDTTLTVVFLMGT